MPSVRSARQVLVLAWSLALAEEAGANAADTQAELDTIEVAPLQTEAAETVSASPAPQRLEEIVVTSQRVKQTVLQVPASVSAVNGEFMRDANITTLNEVQGYVPNVSIKITPAFGELRIRGIGSSISNVGFESSVGAVVDDVYYGRSIFMSAVIFDVDRIEIIRGPQGTLFGKNTIAGVVNVATVPPGSEFGLAMDAVYESFGNDLKLRPAIDLPLGDTLGARVAGNYLQSDGLYTNTTLNRQEADLDQLGGRVKFAWSPLAGLDLDLAAFSSRVQANSNFFQLSRSSPEMLALFQDYDARTEADAFNHQLANNVDARTEVEFDGVQLNAGYAPGEVLGASDVELTLISALASADILERSLDFDFSPVPFVRLDQASPSTYDQHTQELRISGLFEDGAGLIKRTEFIAGLYYFDSQLFSNDLIVLESLADAARYVLTARGAAAAPGLFAGGLLNTLGGVLTDLLGSATRAPETGEVLLDQDTVSYAAYGQITSYLTERFAVILGGRYGRERKEGFFKSVASGIFIPIFLDFRPFEATRVRHETDRSPRLGLKFDWTSKLTSYALASRGFKGGGFNALPFNDSNLEFEPEEASTIELGTKARLFDSQLHANFAAFLTDFDNLQVSTFDGGTLKILNAAEARSQGFEADATWISPWLPGTRVTATLGYTDAYYRHYPNAPAPAESGQDSQDLTGRQLALAPRWTASLTPMTVLPIPGTPLGTVLAVDVLYTGEKYLDVDLDPNTLQPATTVYNARISIGDRNRSWSLTFGANNLTAERTLGQISDQPLAPGNFGAVQQDRGRYYYGMLRLDLSAH